MIHSYYFILLAGQVHLAKSRVTCHDLFMKVNINTVLVGSKVVLVPYRSEHVPVSTVHRNFRYA